jgi:hypothetical protein
MDDLAGGVSGGRAGREAQFITVRREIERIASAIFDDGSKLSSRMARETWRLADALEAHGANDPRHAYLPVASHVAMVSRGLYRSALEFVPLRRIPDIIHFVLKSGWQPPEGLRPFAHQCR